MSDTSQPAAFARPPRKPRRGARGGRLDRGRVTLRLSAEEQQIAHEKAAAAGLNVAAYFRLAALGHAGRGARRRVPVDVAALGRLQSQLGHIGGNLNQIARALNTADAVSSRIIDQAIGEHRALVLEISALLRSTVGA